MKHGSELRKLFESLPNMDEGKFHQLLKGHYDIQNATNILTNLTWTGTNSRRARICCEDDPVEKHPDSSCGGGKFSEQGHDL